VSAVGAFEAALNSVTWRSVGVSAARTQIQAIPGVLEVGASESDTG
jgi:hypothetical protein